MLADCPITAFAATADPEKARAFYRDILGLRLVEDAPFALVFDCNGTQLRIQKVEAVQPPPYTTLGWQVADIEAVVDGLAARGVTFERFDGLPQDDRGLWTAPGSATRIAWFKDPDGNLLSLSG